MRTLLSKDGGISSAHFYCKGEFIHDIGYVVVDGYVDSSTHFWNGTAVQERPMLDAPTSISLPVGGELDIPDCPAGTQVIIDGELAGTTDEPGLSIEFPEARTWTVVIAPPLPYARHTCTVEVV